MKKIWLINGPNLNLLGKRENSVYGHTTLAHIEATLQDQATAAGYGFRAMQSQEEGKLIQWIHQAYEEAVDILLLNPAAYTHTSIALRDALLGTAVPFIEIHLSNIHARETFRRQSYFSDIALGTITGFGSNSYELALNAAHQFLQEKVKLGKTQTHINTALI